MKLKKPGKIFKCLLLTVATALFLIVDSGSKTLAANPTTINFQGKVVNNSTGNVGINVSDGSYSFIFRLYDQSSPTTTGTCSGNAHCWWEETDTLTVTSGVFQVQLGAVCPFTNACNSSHSGINWNTNNALYLTMQFNSDAAGFMSPTIPLTSVPYAFNADSLGGFSANSFVQLAQGIQADTSTSNPSIFINKNNSSGSPNILQLQKAGVNVLAVDNSGTLLLGQAGTGGLNGKLILNNSTNTNTISLTLGAITSSYSLTLPLAVASANSQCLVTTTAGVTSWAACGATNSLYAISLVPEFAGAVMTGDGTNNTGTMTSDFCSGSSALNINSTICDGATTKQHNYYSWTSTGANDYDIWIRWQVPSDFSSFAASNPISWYSRKSATGDDVKLNIYTNTGSACGTGTSMTNTAGSWQTTNYSSSGCTPSAGDILVLDIHMAVAASANTCQMGEITINYNRN